MNRPTKYNSRPEGPAEITLALARKQGILRPRDLAQRGIAPVYLQRLTARGQLVRVGRGLYSVPNADVTEHHSVAEACKRVPRGVVCLLSALRLHGLTTQAPFEVWMAIDLKARAPGAGVPALRVVRMRPPALKAGVERRVVEGIEVPVFSAAKTVADCFKFRGTVGLDVALEALRDFVRRKGDLEELRRFAELCRVAKTMRPYLEALV